MQVAHWAPTHAALVSSSGRDADARNILQHGIGSWAREADFSHLPDPAMAELATNMQRNLVAMGSGDGVGFSQAG